jgi:hypothetical protein
MGITKNVDAVTWVGDLGSILAEAQVKYVNKNADLSDFEIQTVINKYAPCQDMLGNIDAYVIGRKYNISSNNGMKVSEILRDYYLGAGVQSYQNNRYSTFAQSIGLQVNSGNFTNLEDILNYYVDEVNDAAAMYVAAGANGNPAAYPFVIGLAFNSSAKLFINLFFQSLKTAIQSE